jgi:hypothetical protein
MPASRLWFVCTCVLLCAASACSERRPQEPPKTGEDALKELAELYHYLDYSKLAPPKRAEDLSDYWDSLQTAFDRIQNGEIVLLYGVGRSATGAAAGQVLAYEKKAETEGGFVLLRDGTVKQMTSAEFQAAPKAR